MSNDDSNATAHSQWMAAQIKKFEDGIKRTEIRSEGFSYDDAVSYVSRYVEPTRIQSGSMPLASLEVCKTHLVGLHGSRAARPILGIHIGNFVGISLAFITQVAKNMHPESVVVSIDPNITHHTVRNPANAVVGLLHRYGLLGNSLILTGYSLETAGYCEYNENSDMALVNFAKGISGEHCLRNLLSLGGERYDFAVIDGNHEVTYVERELTLIWHLLRRGGLLILDDVSVSYEGLIGLYDSLSELSYERIAADGRIGLLRKL